MTAKRSGKARQPKKHLCPNKSLQNGDKDILLRGGYVLTCDPQSTEGFLDIRLSAGRITAIGQNLEPEPNETIIDAQNRIIAPGFVDAHTHLWQTLLRGEPSGLDFTTFRQNKLLPLEGCLNEAAVHAGVRLGCAELLLAGTTSVLDMGPLNFCDAAFEAAKQMGIRYTGGKTILDRSPGLPAALRETTSQAMSESERLAKRWHNSNDGLLRYAFEPYSVLEASDEALKACAQAASEFKTICHLHLAENSEQASILNERNNHSETQHLKQLNFLGPQAVCAHGIWLSLADRQALRDANVSLVHCPIANLKQNSGAARIAELLAIGLRIALGSESASVADTLDPFANMRQAAFVASMRGTNLSAKSLLDMATCAGALGLVDCGSLKVGHWADILLIRLNQPRHNPWNSDVASRLVLTGSIADIDSVMVSGKWRVRNGQLLDVDTTELIITAQKEAHDLTLRAGL